MTTTETREEQVTPATTSPWRRHILQGILPFEPSRLPVEIVAGITLAALGIPEVMGYAKIAGTPVVTGLYTLLLPVAVFAIFGASRHLVVGADSATAAMLAAGLAGMAAGGSSQYVALAGLLALLSGGFLLAARVVRLGFLADFLSRTVLIGFLTGVGIQVAAGQVGGILGVQEEGAGTLRKLWDALTHIRDTNGPTLAVSLGVIAVIVGGRMITRKVPGALVAVVGAIIASYAVGLSGHGVSVLGTVPGGLPHLGAPSVSWGDILPLLGTAASIFLVILAQSAATSRAYAAKYNEEFDENTDLVGLGFSNLVAGFSGTFVVNGSPTKTQMVDGAGGRSQLAQLTTSAAVLVVLLFLTGPLQYLPNAVLAAVVFLIGIELIDILGMRRILGLRVDEFVVAAITAATVVVVGVEQGILLAIALSIVAHLRHSYRPRNVVLVPLDSGRFRLVPAKPGERTLEGLVIYRFGASLYYANAGRLFDEVIAFTKDGRPLTWFCLDASAINDIDYSAAQTLHQIYDELKAHGVRIVLTDLTDDIRQQIERYGILNVIGRDAVFETAADVVDAYRSTVGLVAQAPSAATADDS